MSSVIGLFSETSLHPGAESTGGVIDLPVAREVTTGYPVLSGSGLKGALKDKFEQSHSEEESAVIFGSQYGAGGIAVSDGRLMLLPVRSLSGHYRWITCPYIMERFQRDLALADLGKEFPIPKIAAGQGLAQSSGSIYLEELSFELAEGKQVIQALASCLAPLIYHQSVRDRLAGQMVILNDDDFSYFTRYGLPVNARNVLDKEKKTSRNLWYEETIPPDTLFYAILVPRHKQEKQLKVLQELFGHNPYLQLGGNETVGQGWCVISWMGGD